VAKLGYKLKLELDALPERSRLWRRRSPPRGGGRGARFLRAASTEVEPVLNEIASTKRALEGLLERWIELEGD
jgi:hypothetical protein